MTDRTYNALRIVALALLPVAWVFGFVAAGQWMTAPTGGLEGEALRQARFLSLMFCWAPTAFIGTYWGPR